MSKKKTKRVTYTKIRNKQYDKLISIISAVVLLLALILFITLPLVKLEVPGFKVHTFSGFQLMFGVENVIKSNILAIIVCLCLVVTLILNIIGIFDRKYCLFSGMLLVLVGIAFVFIKSTISTSTNFENIIDITFKNTFSIYLTLVLIFASSLAQLYITTSENFD